MGLLCQGGRRPLKKGRDVADEAPDRLGADPEIARLYQPV
jgi:hypothetical protein